MLTKRYAKKKNKKTNKPISLNTPQLRPHCLGVSQLAFLTPLKLSSAPDEEKMSTDLNFSTSMHISIMGKVKVTYYVSKNSLSRRLSTLCLLACVASVSNRVTARELEREHLSLPRHSLFFCSRPNFVDELAMKRLLRRLFVCLFVFCVCLVNIAYL